MVEATASLMFFSFTFPARSPTALGQRRRPGGTNFGTMIVGGMMIGSRIGSINEVCMLLSLCGLERKAASANSLWRAEHEAPGVRVDSFRHARAYFADDALKLLDRRFRPCQLR